MPTTDPWNCYAVQAFPLLGMEPWQVHGYGDMAFCLYSDQLADIQTETWGAVKSPFQ